MHCTIFSIFVFYFLLAVQLTWALDTSKWSTYKDDIIGFSFKYPLTLSVAKAKLIDSPRLGFLSIMIIADPELGKDGGNSEILRIVAEPRENKLVNDFVVFDKICKNKVRLKIGGRRAVNCLTCGIGSCKYAIHVPGDPTFKIHISVGLEFQRPIPSDEVYPIKTMIESIKIFTGRSKNWCSGGGFDYKLEDQSFGMIELPAKVIEARQFLSLKYQSPEKYNGTRIDLNDDGTEDFLIQSGKKRCDTGGCNYALFDGANLNEIGLVFGDPLIMGSRRVNGFPVIHAYSHSNVIRTNNWNCYIFDGDKYVLGASRYLGTSLTTLKKDWSKIPTVKTQK